MTFELSVRPFSCPLAEPFDTGGETIETREGFLVRVADGTHAGIGEATPLPGWTESRSVCESALSEAATAAADGPGAALEAVDHTAAARHGVGLALADLAATRDAQPLYRDLGALERVPRVPVNATVGDGTPAETADAARGAVDDGFECVKVKVGRRDVETDIERLQRVRAAVGPSVELRADANGAWTYDEARRALEVFAELELTLLEQPLPAGALEGHAALRESEVAIALDEGLLEHGVDAILEAGAADAFVLKPMALGGVDVARRIAAWCAEASRTPIVTTTIDAVVARTAAVHLAASIPNVPACGVATGSLLASDLGRDPVFIDRGTAVVPQTRGLGVENVWEEE
ncbi:mandelate racemase/muconate lactonizing enzyme family protein [Halovivax sp.]|uniref:mandelate racemase/muconate lactonizing enzyme family protein n=1 Tax=Halovivax sp. TaxID=1935978 RepID=UPI0025C417D3|nr:o-succinylbenzoate synthase [Halovivax sp.]